MRIYIQLISCLCLVVLASCHTTHKATAHRSRQPRFIDDIYMDGHNKNSSTAEAIDKSVKYPEQKYTNRKRTDKPKTKAETRDNKNKVAGKAPVTKPDNDNTPGMSGNIKDKYAGLMGVSRKEVSNASLYNFIDEWYGVDYRMGGVDKDGIDCSGFVQKLYVAVFGIDLVRTSYEQFSNCEHLHKADEATEGDLVFFKTRGKRISHVGVYLMNDYFVHASSGQGIVISSLKEEYWHKHFAGVGRIPKS